MMVLDLPAPVANRLRRPGWRDPRLFAGVAMVAGSVALGSWVVQGAERTTQVYVARDALTPGSAVEASGLGVAQVRLVDVDVSRYLTVAQGLPQDSVALRVVAPGELVPRAALGSAAELDVRPVAIAVTVAPSADLVAGSLVDLWDVPATTRSTGDGAAVLPHELAPALTVAQVKRPDGAFATGGSTIVYVLVPTAILPTVLAAVAGDGAVQLVHVPGSGS
ncbi:flagellar protein FlgA [soil metagenome]